MFQLVIYVMTMAMVPHQVAGQYVFAPKTHMVQATVKREDFKLKGGLQGLPGTSRPGQGGPDRRAHEIGARWQLAAHQGRLGLHQDRAQNAGQVQGQVSGR